ncbi:hypothetical protein OC846_006551 [Tilletia horrida]|uniref:Uncharacterized protein n=1 Tax=Tilletia horrida TaxID=155126 RepID=A0AAN6JQI3_9BASI|nr:hypothetical protein OC845_006557 [Tilletia horrida]KAK0543027.1 hypothetical protein OC846_006551 [Tilletia horrida]
MSSASSTPQPRRPSPRSQRALVTAFAVSYSLTMPLMASAASSSQPSPRDREEEKSLLETIVHRLQHGGDALPRAPSIGKPLQQQQILHPRQITVIPNNQGPESDQPLTIGDVPLSPLLLIIAGMAFSLLCCLFLIVIVNCWNPNNSQTTRDRLRAHQDLRLRGAGRRSVAEPYVFGTSGTSTPNYPSARSSRMIDKRPPPRPANSGGSISSRTPLYSSHLSQASGSVAGSDHRLFPGAIKPGHGSFLSSSSGPFGDSQAALGTNADTGRYSDIVAGPSRTGGASGAYRPAPLPLPPMQQQAFNASHYSIPPGSPRGPRTPGYPASPNKRSNSVKASRSSTIGRGTDIHRQRGSKAFVPAVYPSAVAPAYPNWSSQNHHNAHPLDSSVELKRPATDAAAGSGGLSASRRNSMLSLSAGSNSNEGSSSPHLNNINIGGGGTSPDSASSSHLSTFSNGLTTNPLLPLGSSYLTSGAAAGPSHGASTGDLLGTGYFGSTQARRSQGPGPAPPLPPQKSIYHTRPPAEYGRQPQQQQQQQQPQTLAQSRYDSKPLPGAVPPSGLYASNVPRGVQQSVARQRYDEDVETAGLNVQSGLLQGEAPPRPGRYARRPGGPR